MCNKPRSPSSIILPNSIGGHVAASIQSSAGWQADVHYHTHNVVMEVQDEMLEEMVPVSPRPFTALQTAMAGTLLAALEDEQRARLLCSSTPTQLTAIRGRGGPSWQVAGRSILVQAPRNVATHWQAASCLQLQPHDSAKACNQLAGTAVVATYKSPEPPVRSKPDRTPAVSAASALPSSCSDEMMAAADSLLPKQRKLNAMRSSACEQPFITSAASMLHSHCCDKTSRIACHPCGCGGVACKAPLRINSGRAHRVAWRLPACQLALRVPNACSQARQAVVCKAREVPCPRAT